MSEAIVVFTLDGINFTIKCKTEDKMKESNLNSLNEIISCNNDIEKNINNIKSIIDSISNSSSNNSFNNQIKNINEILNKITEDININNKKIKNLFNDYNNNKNINNNIRIFNKNLLGKIKNIFFLRFIFSHLGDKIKLELVKYNKKLQNKIDIKLINYKFYSCKYIIYETNNKGKEYHGCYDLLLYEGEYLNGKRNGKGKEYDYDGNVIFEGEYLNGKEMEEEENIMIKVN